MSKKSYTFNITVTAMISAVALVLSYIEMSLPDMPFVLPGMKLGLSNIATMFALSTLSLPGALVVCLTKAVFALFMRGFTAFLMSLCAGVLSCIVMWLLLRFNSIGYIGVGVAGAFSHNLGQLLVAFVFTDHTVFSYLFILGFASVATGTLTAIAVSVVLPAVLRLPIYNKH